MSIDGLKAFSVHFCNLKDYLFKSFMTIFHFIFKTCWVGIVYLGVIIIWEYLIYGCLSDGYTPSVRDVVVLSDLVHRNCFLYEQFPA